MLFNGAGLAVAGGHAQRKGSGVPCLPRAGAVCAAKARVESKGVSKAGMRRAGYECSDATVAADRVGGAVFVGWRVFLLLAHWIVCGTSKWQEASQT